MNWTTFVKTEKERIRVDPHVSKPNFICQKRESLCCFLPILSLCLFIYVLVVIVELWPIQRLTSRTSHGKKMNDVDTISSREEPTSISCYEYESVHHLLKKKKTRETKKRKKRVLPPNLIYNWLIVYLHWLSFFSKKTIFYLRAIVIIIVVYREEDIIRKDCF